MLLCVHGQVSYAFGSFDDGDENEALYVQSLFWSRSQHVGNWSDEYSGHGSDRLVSGDAISWHVADDGRLARLEQPLSEQQSSVATAVHGHCSWASPV